MSSKEKEILGWVLIAFNWVLLTPLIIFSLYAFYKRRAHAIIHTRSFRYVMIVNITTIIHITISRPLAILRITYDWPLLSGFDSIIYAITLYCTALMHLGRAWILYFDIKWMTVTNKHGWAQHINTESFKENTFLKYRSTLGNKRWMLTKVWIPVYITVSAILVITRLTTDAVFHLMDITFTALTTVLVGVLWCWIPTVSDQFRIRDELRYGTITGLIAVCVFAVYIVLLATVPSKAFYAIHLTAQPIFSIIFTVFALFNTLWVLNFSGLIFDRLVALKKYNDADSGYNSHSGGHNWTLTRVLSNGDTFDAFMNHCVNEFSSENLLAILEMTQFQIYCQKKYGFVNKKLLVTLPYSGNIANIKSSIVFNKELSIDQKFDLLFQKYIKTGAKFEVNLSSHCRSIMNDFCIPSVTSSTMAPVMPASPVIDSAVQLSELSADPPLPFPKTTRSKQCSLMVRQVSADESGDESIEPTPSVSRSIGRIDTRAMRAYMDGFDPVIMELLNLIRDSFSRFRLSPEFEKLTNETP